MKMLLSLQSTNEDYSTIRTNIDIPWECKYVKYWISCVNFNANMYNITSDDYIEFTTFDLGIDEETSIAYNDDHQFTVKFEDRWIANQTDALQQLNRDEYSGQVRFEYDNNHRLTMNVRSNMLVFNTITPRARMVFGMMDVKLGEEYHEYQHPDEPYTPGDDIYVFDRPITDFANKLYIISKQGNVVHANVGKQDYAPSILASIDTVIRDGQPVIVNFELFGKPIKNRVNIDSFKYLELQLVDMMFNPVKLNVPMFITVKVKPCKVPQMRLSE